MKSAVTVGTSVDTISMDTVKGIVTANVNVPSSSMKSKKNNR